jgi:hypothetical protein
MDVGKDFSARPDAAEFIGRWTFADGHLQTSYLILIRLEH